MLSFQLKLMLFTFVSILFLYSVNECFSVFLKPQTNSNTIKKSLLYGMNFVFIMLSHFKLLDININLIIFFVLLFGATFVFNGSFKLRFNITMAIIWVRVLIEFFIAFTLGYILNMSMTELSQNDTIHCIFSIANEISFLILVKFIKKIKKDDVLSTRKDFIDSIKISIIPILSIFISFSFAEILLQIEYYSLNIVISLISLIIINLFFYYLFDEINANNKLKYENEILKNQAEYYLELEKSVNSTFEKVRLVRHELGHHLLQLKENLDDNTPQSLEMATQKINSLIGDMLTDNIKIYTKNQSVNKILNYKLSSADKNNIDTNIQVTIPPTINISTNDLYIILGNVIDNAVRCFNSSKSNLKVIDLQILDDKGNLYIRISNPYINKIEFKNGLPMTTKKNKILHGIGLTNIQKLVENRGGVLNIETENNIFTLEILLYDETKLRYNTQ